MKSSKFYNKNLDIIRLFACIAVFLYHVGILKGGFFAVCIFFVLSGYLSCVSCFKKEKFSFKEYYLNKLFRLYLPLIVFVFISIALLYVFGDINWYNLKPETNSVLLGYNNFWQLSANMDYFASHSTSPFVHLWYMAIILQFDLIFPFIYIILRKLRDKYNKSIPCILSGILAIGFSVYFYISSVSNDIMVTYYSTFTRVFSLFFGVFLGFIHSYYNLLVPKFLTGKYISKIIFIIYLIVFFVVCIFIDVNNNLSGIMMILVTIITCRLIDYSLLNKKRDLSIVDKGIKSLSSITYEFYLFQYPFIVMFRNIEINEVLKVIIIFILTLISSYILHFCLGLRRNNRKLFEFKLFSLVIVLTIVLFGTYQYVLAKDNTEELKQLEDKLAENEKLMEQREKEYAEKLKKEQEELLLKLENLSNYENELNEFVTNLPIVGIGDSVMLGAMDTLNKEFQNGYFDAAVSRTAWVAGGIIKKLESKGLLGDPVVINLGANGDCTIECKNEIMKNLGERQVFWLNTVNLKTVNADLDSFSKEYDNLHIVDWKNVSSGHPEYFIADGIHLTKEGREAFTKTIYDAIYDYYLNEYKRKKDELINSFEEQQNNKIVFIGNSVLVNAYDSISDEFNEAQFVTNVDFNYETIKKEISKRIEEKTLNHKIVFLFDSSVKLSGTQYKTIIELCNGHEIYIISIDKVIENINYDNVKILNFYNEIISNDSYLLANKIHFTREGNDALVKYLNENIK